MKKYIVLTVCGDPGGARAIAPVIQLLKEFAPDLVTINYAYNQGIEVLRTHQIAINELPHKIDCDWINEFMGKKKPDFLLTATSCNTQNWERFFIATARARNIPSLAVLDFWVNYRERFTDQHNKLSYLPDMIAVMDASAKAEMIAEGIPSDQIMITGQPTFASIISHQQSFSLETKVQFRNALQLKSDEPAVVFISQPLHFLYGDENNPAYYGYTEKTVLTAVICALNKISKQRKKRIGLHIRPHPREENITLDNTQSDFLSIRISKEGNARDCLLSADLVVGMSSALLFEACLLNCIVLSIQPGLRKKDILPSNAFGMSIGIYKENDIPIFLEKMLFDEAERTTIKEKTNMLTFKPKAAGCIVNYISTKLAYEESNHGSNQKNRTEEPS